MKHRAWIAIIFLIGCATGGVASQLVVPPARAGTTPTRWEHYCGRANTGSLTTHLNKVGSEGWELVNVVASHQDHEWGSNNYEADAFIFCAKRALP